VIELALFRAAELDAAAGRRQLVIVHPLADELLVAMDVAAKDGVVAAGEGLLDRLPAVGGDLAGPKRAMNEDERPVHVVVFLGHFRGPGGLFLADATLALGRVLAVEDEK